MQCENISLGNRGAVLHTYFLEQSPEIRCSDKRPCVVVCPGGAYRYTSDREAEPVALAFAARGIHACVLRYPCAPEAHFPDALCALGSALVWIRAHAAQYAIDARQISVCGFSAGGHLAASLGVYWSEPFLSDLVGEAATEMRPDKMILCYPVITAGEYAHKGSIDNLLGADLGASRRDIASLEQHVKPTTPPAFLWHTLADSAVPVENTLLFAGALRKAGVPFELHVYSAGDHGLSLATPLTANREGHGVQPECAGWFDLAVNWLLR